MGSRTFDFLTESFLFHERLIDEAFRSVSADELRREIRRYREFCLVEEPALRAEVDQASTSLVAFSDEPLALDALKQAALYVNQYVVEDPLVALSRESCEAGQVMNQCLGMTPAKGFDRERVAASVRTMKSLTPMVAANFLKFLPTSIRQEPANELPIKFSHNYFEDVLPAEILRMFKDAAVVRSMRKTDGGFLIEGGLRTGRAIHIKFKRHPYSEGFMYLLWEHEATDLHEESRTYTAKLTFPEDQLDQEYFQAWVRQSVNQAADALFSRTVQKLRVAAEVNAVFSTRSELLFRALRKAFKPNSSVPMNTANVFLNLDLPFLAQVNVDQLMKLRQDEGEAFQRFRLLLDQKIMAMRETEDSGQVKKQAQAAIHELTQVQTDELDAKLKGIKERLAINAGIATLGLAAVVQTGGWSLLSAISAALTVGKTYVDYRQELKRHPAFFLWKLLRKSRD